MLWTISAWSGQGASAALLLRLNFLSLIFGAPGALFFAFLLRRVMHWWRSHELWRWSLFGAWLALVPVLLLVPLYHRYMGVLNFNPGSFGFILVLILAGPG